MKITIPTTSASLRDIMGTDIDLLAADKWIEEYRLSVQNLTAIDIYMENWTGETATVAAWYKLFANSEVEIKTTDLTKLYFIADWAAATDVRVTTS